MRRLPIILLLLCCAAFYSSGQDIHFSQYFATPLAINPSYAGSFTGDYRAGMNYRQQWGSVTVPYKTFDFYGDMSFNKNRFHQNYFSLGLVMISDRAGDGNLSITKIMGSGSYHFNLSGDKKNFLSLGLQAGYVQKSVDFTKFYFDNQWADAGFDTGLPAGENFEAQSLSYLDVNAGISYAYTGSAKFSFYSGLAVYHLNQPYESFYGNADNRLGMRPVVNVGAIIQLSDAVYLYPSMFYMSQKKAQDVMAGSMISYELGESESQLYAGFFARFGDALIPVIGYQYTHWRGYLNYDINVSSLKVASGGKGAFELSLAYVGWLKKPKNKIIDIPCPRF